ncbi:hypothetical protein QC764_0091690 [Podospora pseudoanserina]|uniref:Uncharacterized protein n=1 Tax=Podospora pseudoanserina TaxID=2609844 RepID=A0ABR0HTH1_9PEZI|nr:hypothetical protein QC764_0091690 [Podospora pseudoanserina]
MLTSAHAAPRRWPEQDTRTSDVDYTGPATGPVTAPTLLGTPDRTTERPCRHRVALIQRSGWMAGFATPIGQSNSLERRPYKPANQQSCSG